MRRSCPHLARRRGGLGPVRSSRAGAAAHPCVLHPEAAPDQLGDPGQRPALIHIAGRCRARVRYRLQLAQPGGSELALRAARPPAARSRRHRFALIRDIRNRLAISRSLAPASIISAAASRTCSRRARSASVSPAPGYLMPPAYPAACRSPGPVTVTPGDRRRFPGLPGVVALTALTAARPWPSSRQLKPEAVQAPWPHATWPLPGSRWPASQG